jgi:peptidoglycan/LPS O-acetylase OafA/YrhL
MTKHESSDALTHFDFLRGIAAVAVAVGHVRGLYFVDFEQMKGGGALLKALYLVTGFGHQAVVIFFALSGFFVGSSVLSSRDRWSWSQYLLRRFTRLYVVLVPALVLTALLDRTGMALFGASGIYAGKLDAPYLTLQNVAVTGGVGTFLGNAAFLQQIFVDTFGTNGPLWSLAYEFWAYLLFPLLVQATRRTTPVLHRASFVAAAGVVLYFGGERLRFYFPLWLMGALVAGVWSRWRVPGRVASMALRGTALMLFGAMLVLARARFFGHQDRDDVVLAVATSVLLLSLLVTARPTGAGALARAYAGAANHLAGFSYTLYLIHFPPLVFVHAALMNGTRWAPDAKHLALGLALSCAVIWLFAYPLARLTERHTERVRRWAGQALRIDAARHAATS